MARTCDDLSEGSSLSLVSGRLDGLTGARPGLCHELLVRFTEADGFSEAEAEDEPVGPPAIYIAALPLPGLTAGRRLTITLEERGTI